MFKCVSITRGGCQLIQDTDWTPRNILDSLPLRTQKGKLLYNPRMSMLSEESPIYKEENFPGEE